MSAPRMDFRWWVTVTLDRKSRRYPFIERDNAYKFQRDCLDAGMRAEVAAPRNPQRPWETMDEPHCENNGCRDCGGSLSVSCPYGRHV